jgi:hypothetical protein
MVRIALFFASLLILAACRDTAPASTNTPIQTEHTSQAPEGQLPADFDAFYQKFHADSLFQIAHISWPLQGVTSVEVDTGRQQTKTIYWEKSAWRMHRPVDFNSGEFKRQLQIMGDELVVERISYAAANYGLERRFVRRSAGEWELIYYSDMLESAK